MERLNFSHLYYFYVVAKEGSIKEASEKLHVTQPTISDQIRLLEEFLGQKLFERKARSLIINRTGEMVLEYAEKIFDLSQDLTARFKEGVDLPKKSIDIGITYKMSQYFLYDRILPLFNEKSIAVNLREGERRHLLADLESGVLDIVFTQEKELGNRKLSSFELGQNKTFVVAHKKYYKKKMKLPGDLAKINFFNYPQGSSTRYEVDMYFSRYGVKPNTIGEADDIDLHQLVVEEGLAFSIVPEVAANRFIKNKNVIILGEISELNSVVWGIIKNNYRGAGYKILSRGKA